MAKKTYVLWVEDDAMYNLQYIASPIVMNPKYDLTLAITVSEALHYLQRRQYDVIVFDLRLPPGKQQEWVTLNQQLGKAMEPPRLGLHLLTNLYGCANGNTLPLPEVKPPPPITRVGILSVDSWEDVATGLNGLEFHEANYRQKSVGMPSHILLSLVEEILDDLRAM